MAAENRIFLDWNAGAPLLPEARAAMVDALGVVGNASSVHAEGRAARRMVEAARREVAALVGADPRAVVFTAGGTEANVTVLVPEVDDGSGGPPAARLLVSAVEHPSVLAGGRFPAGAVETIPVDTEGRIDIAALEARLAALSAAGERALVSVMAANNETGVIQDVAAVSRLARAGRHLVHADAAQALGRIPLELAALGADFLTLSGHKIGAPRGVGAVVKASEAHRFRPAITGGGQEWRARAGTENLPAIVGFGAAARIAARADSRARWVEIACLRDYLTASLEEVEFETAVFGKGAPRLPNTVAFAVAGVPAETLLIALDLDGFAVSSGAACSSGKVAASHVLEAMGVGDSFRQGAIRASFGPQTARADLDRFTAALTRILSRVGRSRRRGAA